MPETTRTETEIDKQTDTQEYRRTEEQKNEKGRKKKGNFKEASKMKERNKIVTGIVHRWHHLYFFLVPKNDIDGATIIFKKFG